MGRCFFYSRIGFCFFLAATVLDMGCGPTKDSPEKKHFTISAPLSTPSSTSSNTVPARSARHGGLAEANSLEATPATLAWDEPIRLKKFGLSDNPNIEGKTLKAIVESLTPGRDDHQLCSACHNNEEASGNYGVDVDKLTSYRLLDPWTMVGTTIQRSWAGRNGWADQFSGNSTKPPALKALMRSWKAGGYQIDP